MKKRKKNQNAQENTEPVAPAPSRPERDYEAEDALHTLTRAEKIRGDRHLMRRVVKHHRSEDKARRRALRLEGRRL